MSAAVQNRRMLWVAVGLLAAAELAVAALTLAPRTTAAYRAYYIERSSDCWPHDTAGDYTLGTPLSFIARSGTSYAGNKVCGWFYSDARGTWSYGRYSLLRFRFAPVASPLTLTLTAGAAVDAASPMQRVVVSADGAPLATLSFDTREAQMRTLVIPAAVAADGLVELRFDYPDARSGRALGPNEDSHLRAIRMVALSLSSAP